MNSNLLAKVHTDYRKLPEISTGDTVSVKTIIREKDKKRFQTFKGVVIALKGSGMSKTFTVRKISFGIGVEKIFPLYSPNIETLEILKKGKVRRSKIYYLRNRIGKSATKVKGEAVSQEELDKINLVETEVVEVPAKADTTETNTEVTQETADAKAEKKDKESTN